MLKATDDFKQRSLSVLPTLLEKLAYICSLQTNEGKYRHWGLSRTHGENLAQHAICTAHVETATELIHSPIREIYREYQQAMRRSQGPEVFQAESLVLTAPVSGDGLLSAHLRLLQDSVQALALQERTTPQGA
ncbi:MAG TPA: hypothetical protein VFI72_10220 [Candidatus Angelobacter sp.]|nr:hypothetical protein [Candidatus Angelobacter sp.]